MDLRDRLRRLDPNLSVSRPEEPVLQRDIDGFVEGEEVENEYGRFFRTIAVYNHDHVHGSVPLSSLMDVDPDIFGLVGNDRALIGVDLKRAVFFDTETTGLAGGTGTVPFLIGMGYYHDDGFRVEQCFMRDLREERAVLSAVAERMRQADALVSYNGKAYDMNVLMSRFILSRMENPSIDLPHLDLLFTARRLWKRRLSDCSLSNIERHVLDYHRVGDIPGFMIPGLYFEYLRTRNGQALASVFKHNRWDIVSLVALAALAGRIYTAPADELSHAADLIGMGRAFQKMERLEDAATCFHEALNRPGGSEDAEEALRFLGFSFKRLGRWQKAVAVWERMIEVNPHNIEPYEEAAKYYEHRVKDLEKARDVVERALERMNLSDALGHRQLWSVDRRDLEYRLARILRKLRGPSTP